MVESAVLVAALAVAAALALAFADGYSHWTVPAVGPWAVVGGALHVAIRAGVYESSLPPRWTEFLLVVPALLAATTWIVTSLLAASRDVPYRERYLGAAGLGCAFALVVLLLAHLQVSAGRLVWVIGVPLVAFMVATVGFLGLGFLVADLLTDLRVAGLYTVVTVVFEGVAAVTARRFLDASGDALVADALRSTVVSAGVDPTWWLLVVGQLAVGLLVVLVCGRLARFRAAAGQAAVLVVSVLALWSGTVVLLTAAAPG